MTLSYILLTMADKGLTLTIKENPLGIAASDRRVINIELSNGTRTVYAGIPFEKISTPKLKDAIIEMQLLFD